MSVAPFDGTIERPVRTRAARTAVERSTMTVAVPFVAGTAVKGVAATAMMRGVLQRHPDAFLITLARFGVTLPLHRSQDHITADIRRGLAAQGRPPDGRRLPKPRHGDQSTSC